MGTPKRDLGYARKNSSLGVFAVNSDVHISRYLVGLVGAIGIRGLPFVVWLEILIQRRSSPKERACYDAAADSIDAKGHKGPLQDQ